MPELIKPRVQRGLRAEGGFSLVEVMVGSMLLVVGALAVLSILMSSSKASTSTTRQEVAINQAEKHMEWLRALAYSRLWLASAPTPSADSKDPRSRLAVSGATTSYEVSNDPARAEELVTSGETAGGTWSGINPGPVAFSIGTGGQTITGKIYTFVSWRDEECPVLRLGNVDSTLSSLAGTFTAKASESATLASQLTNQLGSLANSTTKKLTGQEKDISGQPFQRSLPALQSLLNSTGSDVTQARSSSGFQNALAGGLDLCDLNTSQLSTIKRLSSVPSDVQSLIATTSSPNGLPSHKQVVDGILGLLGNTLCSVLALLSNCDENLNADANDFYNNDMSAVQAAASSVRSDLSTLTSILANGQDTKRNTKRITVAVTVDSERSDIAPQKPIWSSTVVVNPDEGLL